MPKRRNQRDVISTLPDEILCQILSLLPTRTSMATSLLSRRWRYLWRNVQVLDLNDDFCYTHERSDEDAEEYFLTFLKEVVPRFDRVRKFRLSCQASEYVYEDLFDWIDYAIGRVRELHFSMKTDGEIYTMHPSYMRSTWLMSLVLEGNIHILLEDLDPGRNLFFPSLKNLKLDITYVNLERFLSGCPNLEFLWATFENFTTDESDFHPEAIRMPRPLKILTLEERCSQVTLEHLEIDTPSLEYLHLSLWGDYKQILVCDYPNMKKACLEISPKPSHVAWLPKLLRALCKTEFLTLHLTTIQCLLRAPVLELPNFCNLIQLQLFFQGFESRLLVDLLHNCPKLQALLVGVFPSIDDYFNRSYQESHKPSGWTQPNSIPKCVISHLNTFEYGGCYNTAEEHDFIAYILQKGLVLKTMRIHAKAKAFYGFVKPELYEALSNIPRGSSMCRLEVV
ncbi:hypothetical protein PIB30_060792 [Stylosanthes scabra]|uniref:F-box domain-containing protein n=1 Tax=Stylosanthes scabra TaxID=79078 RepID=A0ABU6WNF0_9FABA|nr:hypothetical protein [Stylosanthes scabra]